VDGISISSANPAEIAGSTPQPLLSGIQGKKLIYGIILDTQNYSMDLKPLGTWTVE
jgi:hypothetical protein